MENKQFNCSVQWQYMGGAIWEGNPELFGESSGLANHYESVTNIHSFIYPYRMVVLN